MSTFYFRNSNHNWKHREQNKYLQTFLIIIFLKFWNTNGTFTTKGMFFKDDAMYLPLQYLYFDTCDMILKTIMSSFQCFRQLDKSFFDVNKNPRHCNLLK